MTLIQKNINQGRKKVNEVSNYQRTQMQKEMIIEKLKEQGCRITKQRLILLSIILENECTCCKEIYYKATKEDHRIGMATVYRMINILEEIGAISRKNMYKVACSDECEIENVCTVKLDDNSIHHLSAKKWISVIKEGLKACGYTKEQNVLAVTVKQYESDIKS